MLAYRLISGDSLLINRSFCPSCKKTIAWYDNIPLISWFVLHGTCRACKQPISWLYPFIELVTTVLFMLLVYYIQPSYWMAYFLFFSGLIISIRTDVDSLLISRFASLYLIPIGWLFAYKGLLPIDIYWSILGSISAYSFLWIIAHLFYVCTKKVGMGQGDIELLAFIGAFLGIIGWWASILIGSLLGSIVGISYMIFNGKYINIKIPFGPFLALGAFAYIFLAPCIQKFLFCCS